MFLLITDRKNAFQEMLAPLLEYGFFILLSPFETAVFLAHTKDVGGAVIDCADGTPRGVAICRQLRLSYPEMPVAVIATGITPFLEVDCILREHEPQALAARLTSFFCNGCGWRGQRLSTYYLTVDAKAPYAVYMGYPLPLTPREHRILYCLFYHAPRTVTADDLIALTAPLRPCSVSTLSRHIRAVNRSAAAIAPCAPSLIACTPFGYRLSVAALTNSQAQ